MNSDNPPGEPDNQQGRLEAYLSGFADGEGTFSIGITRRPDLRFGFQLIHEFRVSQNSERGSILSLFQRTIGCGRIAPNHRTRRSDRSLVLVVRKRRDLLDRVIPFFHRNPLLSEKRFVFDKFETIVTAMAVGRHHTRTGFDELLKLAHSMNGEGRYRRWQISDVIDVQNPQRLYAEHPPASG
jgi:hypothetical protein